MKDCRVDLGMDSRLKRKLVDVVLGSCRGQFQVRLGLKNPPKNVKEKKIKINKNLGITPSEYIERDRRNNT